MRVQVPFESTAPVALEDSETGLREDMKSSIPDEERSRF